MTQYTVPRKTNNYILEELLKAKDWLISLEIDTKNTRFESVLNNVQEIVVCRKQGTLENLIKEKGNEVLWFSLTESATFLDIYSTFSRLEKNRIPRKKIREALNGPFLPREEKSGSSNVNNRNTLFELELAAHLMKRNIDVYGFDDIKFHHYGYSFNVECKRLFSKRNITHNIEEAYNQLKKSLNGNATTKGIIALSIEKVCRIDDKILSVNDATKINSNVYNVMNKFIQQYKSYWNSFMHLNFMGMIFVLRFIVDIKNENLLCSGYQIDFVPKEILTVAEEILINKLGQQLNAIII